MADDLATLEALIRGLGPEEKAALDRALAGELNSRWLPNPGPQADAYWSDADLTLFGGAAGGGKTELLLGLALTQHKRSVIFRRAYVDLRGIEERLVEIMGGRTGYNGHDMVFKRDGRLLEFGALEKPGAEYTWQGRPHDFIGFDEGAQLSATKISFVIGWLRTTDAKQRCRIMIASNPPMGGEGDWLISWFAPWLDPLHPDPAEPGELRWAYVLGTETQWAEGPGETMVAGETYTHMSRTFIPSFLDDNPYLKDTGYRARIQSMPEPLRSQLLKGDFLAGREDAEWQVIPSEWVRKANERWVNAEKKRRHMIALAGDIALGGHDNTVLAALHEDAWFAPMVVRKGADFKEPNEIAVLMLATQRDGADLSVDGTGGWGSGVRSHLRNDHGLECASLVFSQGTTAKTKDGKLGYANLRAKMYWRLREALDPEDGDEIMLPPDTRLFAELTAARYKVRGTNILIEDKDEIRKRLGVSPDEADAVVMAWERRKASLKPKKPKLSPPRLPSGDQPGVQLWMNR